MKDIYFFTPFIIGELLGVLFALADLIYAVYKKDKDRVDAAESMLVSMIAVGWCMFYVLIYWVIKEKVYNGKD